MKKVVKVLALLIVVWISVTYFFITEHTVVGKEALINQSVVFDDMTIQLDRLLLVNAERKPWDIRVEKNQRYFEIANKLPAVLAGPLLRLYYIYSSPYLTDDERYHTYLTGKCIFKDDRINPMTYFEHYRDNYAINVQDHVGQGYSSGSGSSYEDGNKEIDITVRGHGLKIKRLSGGMIVIIKQRKTGQIREIQLDFQDFKNYEYNDSFAGIKALSMIK